MLDRQLERETQRRLRELIGLARRIAKHARFEQTELVACVALGCLCREERLAALVANARPENPTDLMPTLRAMVETWVDFRWICNRDSWRRSNRFIKFELVARVRALEELSGTDASELRVLKRRRGQVRHLFYDPRRRRWASGWTNMSMRDRVEEIRLADRVESSDVYAYYRVFSASVHTDVSMLGELRFQNDGSVALVPPRTWSRWTLANYAAVLLTDVCGLANERMGSPYAREVERARALNRRFEARLAAPARRPTGPGTPCGGIRIRRSDSAAS